MHATDPAPGARAAPTVEPRRTLPDREADLAALLRDLAALSRPVPWYRDRERLVLALAVAAMAGVSAAALATFALLLSPPV